MPLDDAQFLATRQFQILEIARMYRSPPNKLVDYSQAHQTNVEEPNRNYEQTTLLGWAIAIEAESDNKLLFQSETRPRDLLAPQFRRLRRGNTQVRTSYYQVDAEHGRDVGRRHPHLRGHEPDRRGQGRRHLPRPGPVHAARHRPPGGIRPQANPLQPAAEAAPPDDKPAKPAPKNDKAK